MGTSSAEAALGLGAAGILVFVGLVVTGCGGRQAAAPGAADAAPAAKLALHGTVDAGTLAAPDLSACPGSVLGSSVRVKNVQDGLQVTITARNPKAIEEIRRRANRLASGSAGPALHPTAGCIAGYLAGAETTTEDVKGGIRITVLSVVPDGVAGVRKSAHDRVDAMAGATGREGAKKKSS
jgi:hypothetical protein